jgi:hypothetical protein
VFGSDNNDNSDGQPGEDGEGTKAPGGDAITVSNQQVYLEDESTPYTGSGDVKIAGGAITVGSITNGKLAFTLPSTVDSKYLLSFSENMPSGITLSQPDVRGITSEGDIGLYDGNRIIDYLFLMKTVGKTMHSITYWYFDRECSISGNANGLSVSINASVGWNKVYMVSTESGSTNTGTATTNSSNFPSDLKWVSQRNGGY